MTALRAYIGHAGDPQEGAVLVYARSAKEARLLAWPVLNGWDWCEWLDVRARWIRGGADFHRVPAKEEAGAPYVVESPDGCERCELWYGDGLEPTTRLCWSCFEDDAAWDAA